MMDVVTGAKGYGINKMAQTFRSLTLRFIDGLHAGAEYHLREGEWLILGTAEDCDMLLGDHEVAAHHCLIGMMGGKLCLRGLESVVLWDDIEIALGELRTVFPPGVLKMGGAQIAIEPEVRRTPASRAAVRHYAWVAFSLLFSTSATYVMAVSLFGESSSGIAGDQPQHDVMQADNQPHRESVEDEQGRRIASSVRDVMRLSGIDAETRYLHDGTVEVTGYFGDGRAVASAVQSRAVREIRGLKRIQVANRSIADASPTYSPQPDLPSSATKMVKIIYGDDPYLVVTDGSRYYPGARLPNGASLVSILDKEAVLVKTANGEEILMSASELF